MLSWKLRGKIKPLQIKNIPPLNIGNYLFYLRHPPPNPTQPHELIEEVETKPVSSNTFHTVFWIFAFTYSPQTFKKLDYVLDQKSRR